MKKALFILNTLTICLLLISSCGKKTDNGVYIAPGTNGNGIIPGNNNNNGNGNGNGNSGSGTLTATINGTIAFSTSNIIYTDLGVNAFTGYTTSPLSTVAILLDSLNVGTHKFQLSYPAIGYSRDTSASYYSFSTSPLKISSGSIIITANTGSTITGTFSGTAYNYTNASDSVKITNGVFTGLSYK